MNTTTSSSVGPFDPLGVQLPISALPPGASGGVDGPVALLPALPPGASGEVDGPVIFLQPPPDHVVVSSFPSPRLGKDGWTGYLGESTVRSLLGRSTDLGHYRTAQEVIEALAGQAARAGGSLTEVTFLARGFSEPEPGVTFGDEKKYTIGAVIKSLYSYGIIVSGSTVSFSGCRIAGDNNDLQILQQLANQYGIYINASYFASALNTDVLTRVQFSPQ